MAHVFDFSAFSTFSTAANPRRYRIEFVLTCESSWYFSIHAPSEAKRLDSDNWNNFNSVVKDLRRALEDAGFKVSTAILHEYTNFDISVAILHKYTRCDVTVTKAAAYLVMGSAYQQTLEALQSLIKKELAEVTVHQ